MKKILNRPSSSVHASSGHGAQQRVSTPSALLRVCGIASDVVRSRQTLPLLSIAAMLTAAGMNGLAMASVPDAGSESSSESSGEGSTCPNPNGGCSDEEDGNSDQESVDNEDGEVCQDEAECPCDNGGGATGETPSDPPVGGVHPVAWDTGEKWEQMSDLYVKVKGKDFQLTRQYSSHPDMISDLYDSRIPGSRYSLSVAQAPSHPSVGEGWAFSSLRAVTFIEHWGCVEAECFDAEGTHETEVNHYFGATAWLARPGRKPREYNVPTVDGSSNSTAPGNQYVRVDSTSRPQHSVETGPKCGLSPCTVTGLPTGFIDGKITFVEPGRWEQEFTIEQGTGWISREEDEYGNTRLYDDADADGFPDTIYLNGTDDTDSEAWIDLFWIDTATGSTPTGSTTDAFLVRAEVYRPTSSSSVMTQYVEYYHLDNDGSNDIIKYHNGTSYGTLKDPANISNDLLAADDLGTVGDLVQVVRYTAVDPSDSGTDWRSQITQYRYHDTEVDAPTTGDIRLRIEGQSHQLKMVFKPQQLEFIAQQRLGSGTPDDMTVVDEACKLLAIEDDGTADSTNGISMYEVAEKIVSYDRDYQVVVDSVLVNTYPVDRQFLQATSCGCGGGASTAVLRTYTQADGWETDIDVTTDIPGESMQITEYEVTDFNTEPTTVYRTLAYDLLLLGPNDNKPYVWMKTVIEEAGAIIERGGTPGTDAPRSWVTQKEYDLTERAVTGWLSPSMFSGYTRASGSTTAPSATMVSNGGYGERYTYDATSNNENVGVTKIVTRSSGNFASTTVANTEYESSAEYLEFLPTSKTAFRGGSNPVDEEVVTFAYGLESSSARINWRKITIEREDVTTENGDSSATAADYYEFYDNSGKLIWEMDPDEVLARYEYDFDTGVLVKVVRNSETPSELTTPSDPTDPLYATLNELDTSGGGPTLPTSASGTPLTTSYTVDLMGRVTSVTRPGDVTTTTVREMRQDSLRPGILYFAKVRLPHEIAASEFSGPAMVQWYDAAYKMTRSSGYELDIAGSDYAYASTNSYDLDTELSRSASVHDLSGTVTKRKSWWELGETHETVHESTYAYDEFGRMSSITDAEGSVSAYTHDAFNRVTETKVGTTSSSPVTVSEYFYDGDPGASTPDHGVGNGNLTAVALYDGETSDARITRMYYDERDRMIGAVSPVSAMSVMKYDNLNRVIEEAAYGDPSLTSNPIPSAAAIAYLSSTVPNDDTTHGYGERAWHTVTDYSQRGLVWRQRVAIDPAEGTSPTYLDWLAWYDAEGNELASWGPNSPMTVYEYDEHDRVSKLYVSDRLTEATGSLTHANATSVSGDTVLEQAEYTYDDDSGGVLELIKTKMRVHDATATGALADADSITSYLGLVYDGALRQVGTVNFGTNKSDFADGTTTAPTLSSYDSLSDLRAATDVLFSWQTYNTRGLVDEVISIQTGTSAADEIHTKYLYDDLSRAFAVIENYDDASLSWSTSEGRYVASNLDYADLSEDRVTSFVHDKTNKVTKRVAHIPADPSGEDVQVTEYEYGVAAGSTSNIMDSLVASNNLLSRVKYPDEATGEAGASSKYYVDYAFNRLGELRGVTDQNRTIREFERDEQGRVTADIVDTITTHIGSNPRDIDGSIRRISYGYDALGRMTNATSHTSVTTGNIRDEVEIEYTPLWQVEKVYQQHDGSVNTSTSPTVEYVYDNAAASGATGNYSRLVNVNYPTDVEQGTPRDTVGYVYGTGTIDDRISRVSTIQVNGLNFANDSGSPTALPVMADLISYDRIGLGLVAQATIGVGATGFDVMLDRTVDHEGDRSSGLYPSFDKFGRIVSHMWVRDDFGEHGTVSELSNQPAYLEVTHTYDRSSNRLTYSDNRQGAKLPSRSRAFTYDRLNRLTEDLRTPVPSGSTYTPQHSSKQWALDTLGNWDDVLVDADDDGSFTDNEGSGYKDVREHNMANEIESGLQYDQRLLRSGTTPIYHDHLYDDNGNMTDERSGTSLPSPGTLMAGQKHTYDAWNRLVKTEYVPSSGSNVDVSVNTYNALGWRTSREFDESAGAFDGLDQKRLYYYSADWRMLEERIDTDVSTNSDSSGGSDDDVDWIGQQFWGIRYIDDAVGKRVDRSGTGDFINDDTGDTTYWYQLTDTQFSVCVVLDGDGNVYEQIEYDAYGRANHRYAGDADGNNTVTNADMNLHGGDLTINLSGYHADLDVNCDGTINSIDVGIIYGHTPFSPFGFQGLPSGWISDPSSSSGPDNSVGYAGYVFNHEREDYTVRFRNYNPELGRWMQRDPIGHLGGKNLNAYVRSSPTLLIDPYGLQPELVDPGSGESLQCKVLKEKFKKLLQHLAKDCPETTDKFLDSIENSEQWAGIAADAIMESANAVLDRVGQAGADAVNAARDELNKMSAIMRARSARRIASKHNFGTNYLKIFFGKTGGKVLGVGGVIKDGNESMNSFAEGDYLHGVLSGIGAVESGAGVAGKGIPVVGWVLLVGDIGEAGIETYTDYLENKQYDPEANGNCAQRSDQLNELKRRIECRCGVV